MVKSKKVPQEPKEIFKSGFVAIVGRPNVGKSTLLNKIVGEKVAIVSQIPQTTRHQIRGMYNDDHCQIIFIDTPGIHLGGDKLDQFMVQSSTSTFDEVDCIIHLVDPSRRVGEEEHAVIEQLKRVKVPIILGLNKVDIKDIDIAPYIALWEKAKGKPIHEIPEITIIALSAKDGKNIDELIKVITEKLPEGQALYPNDVVTDLPQKMAVADIIREKFYNLMKEEIPHSLGIFVEDMKYVSRKKTTVIKAVILVERDSQKEIVIGKKGAILKQVGTESRQELQNLLETKVFLELHVKVQKDWRNSVDILQQLGYQPS